VKGVFWLTLPLAASAALFAPEWLSWWINETFARESAYVAQCLALAVMINCMAFVPHTTLQAVGRADWCAKLHLAELPPYLVLVIWLASDYGINGVALAWFTRSLIDAFFMFHLAEKALGRMSSYCLRVAAGCCGVLVGLALLAQVDSIAGRAVILALIAVLAGGMIIKLSATTRPV
jgi:O-antigen/teichoic acid export membrane protein